jgi:hypothetical protein
MNGNGFYGARTIKRARRTKAAVEELERQIFDVLHPDHPQSIRHVFYRLTDPRLPEPVAKTERGYRVVQMPAGILRDLLRGKIESYLPVGALEVARVAEQSERAHLRRWAALIEGAGR